MKKLFVVKVWLVQDGQKVFEYGPWRTRRAAENAATRVTDGTVYATVEVL